MGAEIKWVFEWRGGSGDDESSDARSGAAQKQWEQLQRERPAVDPTVQRRRQAGGGQPAETFSPRRPTDAKEPKEPKWYKSLSDAFPPFGRAVKLWEVVGLQFAKSLFAFKAQRQAERVGPTKVEVVGVRADRPRPQPPAQPMPGEVRQRRPQPPAQPGERPERPFRSRTASETASQVAASDKVIYATREGVSILGKAAAAAAATLAGIHLAGVRRAAGAPQFPQLPPPRVPGGLAPIVPGAAQNPPAVSRGGPLVLQGVRARPVANQQVVDAATGAPIAAGRVPWLAVAAGAVAVAGAFWLVSGKAKELVGRLASYSGILAASQARAEVARIRQDISLARKTGPDFARWNDTQTRLSLAIDRIVTAGTQIGAKAFQPILEALATIAENTAGAIDQLDKIDQFIEEKMPWLARIMEIESEKHKRLKREKDSDLFQVFGELKDLGINDEAIAGNVTRQDVTLDTLRLPV